MNVIFQHKGYGGQILSYMGEWQKMTYQPVSRLLTVLHLLYIYEQLSATELAERLEVDVRTVRRYITTLKDLGVDIVADMGAGGGYRLAGKTSLLPTVFTPDELKTLLLVLEQVPPS